MANVKITQLPGLSTMTNEAIMPVVADGITKQISGANLANFFGGNASTGNVTFNNQVVQGTGTNDGGGGLYLAPGPDSIANSAVQYLRVRGGDYVTHIHLDTGNNAYYDQYFGADSKYVKLEANGNIVINADDGASSATWTFGAAGAYGELTLPSGEGIIKALDDTIALVSLNTTTGNANSVYLGSGGGLGFNDQEIGGNWLEIFRSGTEPEIRVPVGRGNLNIQTAEGGNVYNWTFDNTGLLTLPGNLSADNLIINTIKSDDSSFVNIEDGVNVTGAVIASGNITGSYFLGNGSALTGIDATSIQNGISNVRVLSSGGSVSINVGGASNIALFTTTGASIGGTLSTSGFTATGTVTLATASGNINLGSSQTTGNVTVGGTAQTGTILIGQSISSQTINIGHGITGSGNTKTIQIGENGAAGSTTIIDIGPVSATTAAGTVTFNTATVVAIANTSGTALSVAGNITGGNINTGSRVVTTPVAYSTLTAVTGARAFVNDGNLVALNNFGVQVSGGGANTAPVWSDGTNWYIG